MKDVNNYSDLIVWQAFW